MNERIHEGNKAKVVLVEVRPGMEALPWVEAQWQERGFSRDWIVNGAYEKSGTWAGVTDWFRAMLTEMENRAPQLVQHHNYELLAIMPELRRRMKPRNPCLTDLAKDDERVRNFPVDRAFRIVTGLVDCLAGWKSLFPKEPWTVACLGFHESGSLARRFWLELARCKGRRLDIQMWLTVESGLVEALAARIRGFGLPCRWMVASPAAVDPETRIHPEGATARAQELEALIEGDFIQREIEFPRLIRLCKAAGNRRKWLYWQETGLGFCNHNGYYEDAMFHGEVILEHLDLLTSEDEQRRWTLTGNLIHPLISTGRMEQALHLVEKAHESFTSQELLARSGYMLGIFHGRYLPQTDQERASTYLERAQRDCAEADMAPESKVFLSVFFFQWSGFCTFQAGPRGGSDRIVPPRS